MALAYSFNSTESLAPAITYSVRFDQLNSLVGRRVCVHSGGISVAGRLYRGVQDIFQVSIDTVDSFADAPVRPEQVKNISFSRDTLSPDPVVAYIYLT